jgi:FKBP-type peptidyl-prolyl cis-trans isomerase (trigger factor)
MYTLGLASKETCDNGDTVKASLQFFVDGKELNDFTSTSTYVASSEGDSIVKSFVGKKLNEEYEVEYTFPENDADYPGKLANVKIKIVEITSPDPIKEGFVEKNIEGISKYLDNVTDAASFLKACEPKLAESTIEMYLKDYLTKIEGIEVPGEYADCEMYRLKARLNQLGYTYEKYLQEINMTDEEAKQYCKDVARENYIYLLICKKYDVSLTGEQVQEYYGSNYDTIKDIQGIPYMKLNMLRDAAIYKISTTVKLAETK